MHNFDMKNLENSSTIYKEEKKNFRTNFFVVVSITFIILLTQLLQLIFNSINASNIINVGIPVELSSQGTDAWAIWMSAINPVFYLLVFSWIIYLLFKSYKDVDEKSDFRRIRGLGFYMILLVITFINAFPFYYGAKAIFTGTQSSVDKIITFPVWVSMFLVTVQLLATIVVLLIPIKTIKKIIFKFSIAKSSEDLKILMNQNQELFKDQMFPFGPTNRQSANYNNNKTSEEQKVQQENVSAEQKKRQLNEEKLNNLTLGELRSLAKKQHIFGVEEMKRKELIEILLNTLT